MGDALNTCYSLGRWWVVGGMVYTLKQDTTFHCVFPRMQNNIPYL